MALSALTVWEVETGGSDTNGGGFVTGASGTDWTQQPSAKYALVNGQTQGTTVILTPSAAADMVGNIAYVQGGTGSVVAAWYQIVSVVVGTSITVDRSTGLTSGTGATVNIGGALGSLGILGAVAVLGNTIYVKAGTYSISTATANVSGGTLSANVNVIGIGYSTNRTPSNTDTQPVLQYGVSGVTMFTFRGAWINLAIDGNSQTSARLSGAGEDSFIRCTFKRLNLAAQSPGPCVACVASGCSAAQFVSSAFFCEATGCTTAVPFVVPLGGLFSHCISYGNSIGGFTVSQGMAVNCISYGNAGDGFAMGASAGVRPTLVNCHAESNSGFGYSVSGSPSLLQNCSAYSNTSGATSFGTTNVANMGFIPITVGSVFVNASGSNFMLNNLVNQGAALRAAGFVSTTPSSASANYLDIGACQHQDAPASIINQIVNVRFGDEA